MLPRILLQHYSDRRGTSFATGTIFIDTMANAHINDNVYVKATSEKGLGLFATVGLSKGLKIVDEDILLAFQTRHHARSEITVVYDSLDDYRRLLLQKLCWGTVECRARLKNAECHLAESLDPQRLENIVQYNGIEGQGAGYVISMASSLVNHE